jgi:ketosteroid isomerase-like protein
VNERQKLELFHHVLDAWNRGDLDGVLAECTPDWEWDMTRSEVPGLSEAYRGREGYLTFAQSWRETLGPTQLEFEEGCELDDGRLYTLIHQTATGPQSGVAVELHYVQITEFEHGKIKRSAVFGDREEGRAAAGLDG